MNFDIDCLRSFALVAETMSFSRAAENVCRSQSTVSQQINKLEEQLKTRLLVRRKGRVLKLTPDGSKLLQFAQRILQLNDEAYSSMADDALTGFVRLGVPLDFFGRNFTTWLAGFKTMHPMVALEVESNQSENLMKRCERGEFDLAFFKQEAGAKRGTVALREQLVWATARNYVPSLERSLPLILFPEGCAYRRFAIATLQDRKLSNHISFVSPSFECLKTAVVEGLGITVLARALVSEPMRVVGHRIGLPPLPPVELVYMFGQKSSSRVVIELAHYLTDRLTEAAPAVMESAA
ncbi:MAG: LysR family transcriptional regulator [Rhizobiales bacterium]|nr:LysR family transcriptional regulator [Hyphomicrobiales bacterium]